MKEDARFIKNEEKIIEAFKQLVLEMNFENITVKELSERANINRKTFYLHYASIDELVKSLEIKYCEEYIKFIGGLDIFHDYKEIIKRFYLFHIQKGEFMDKLTCDPNYEYIRNQMINKFKESYINTSIFEGLDKHRLNIAINYMHNTTLSLYKAWVNDNKVIPFDEIVELNYNLVINGLSGLTKKD